MNQLSLKVVLIGTIGCIEFLKMMEIIYINKMTYFIEFKGEKFLKEELTELHENWKTYQQNTETIIYSGALVVIDFKFLNHAKQIIP